MLDGSKGNSALPENFTDLLADIGAHENSYLSGNKFGKL
jgi:hypothetical protein